MTIKTREIDYDSLRVEEAIHSFLNFARAVGERHKGNLEAINMCDDQTQDLLHYMELQDDLNCCHGNELYRKLREVRRERRTCKNENELLDSIHDWVDQNAAAIKSLERVLGATRAKKDTISKRLYMTRTNILEEER